jgi:hypothetical protein
MYGYVTVAFSSPSVGLEGKLVLEMTADSLEAEESSVSVLKMSFATS